LEQINDFVLEGNKWLRILFRDCSVIVPPQQQSNVNQLNERIAILNIGATFFFPKKYSKTSYLPEVALTKESKGSPYSDQGPSKPAQ
jgi:hypothetical protein